MRPLLALLILVGIARAQPGEIERALALPARTASLLYRTEFTAHWLNNGSQFWYAVPAGPETMEFTLVDMSTGKIARAPTFEALQIPAEDAGVATAPVPRRSVRTGEPVALHLANRRVHPVQLFWLDPEGKRAAYGTMAAGAQRTQPTYAGHVWLATDEAGNEITRFGAELGGPPVAVTERSVPPPEPADPARDNGLSDANPPPHWSLRFENHQVVSQNTEIGELCSITSDGTAAQPYQGPVSWSPDGRFAVALSVRTAPMRQVTIVESTPAGGVQPQVHTFDYQKPGDALPFPQPVLVDLSTHAVRKIDPALFPNPFTPDGGLRIQWSPKSDEFYFDYNQRGHQLYRVLAVNAETAAARTVVEETARTFIDYPHATWRRWLPATGELLWLGERDGWNHLWLYETATGRLKGPVTSGAWVVRDVLRVDEMARLVWFLASGLRADEDPYHLHLCRVDLDGSHFRRLTEGDGNHAIEFSPDHRYFIDRWSRADLAPRAELRRTDDGSLVCALETADAAALLTAGWTMPERFVAKGRDGKTDIHGVIYRPARFDPAAKYPVLEEVYAGPHGAFAPKDFGRELRQHQLAELGFIVVQVDGMGTNFRGRAFHDVAWQNLQDAGFPDRIAWIKAAAATRPWMDLTRVGIYGGSAGGQNAMRALLDHHDFYRAAFADCGCHDNRMDKIWWNELWLGWPIGDAYLRASNVVDASKLQGSLMLCVGELDHNVDPASTMQVVHALEAAHKDFELLVIPGVGHGAAETPYGLRRRMEFFLRTLRPPS